MREQLRKLYKLQELDRELLLHLKNLKEHPILGEFSLLKGEYEQSEKELSFLAEKIKEKKKKIRKMELDLQEMLADIQEIRGKLYGGEVSSGKELGQYEKKLQSKERAKESKEEEVFEVMEEVEESEERGAIASKELKHKRIVFKDLQVKVQLQLETIKNEIAQLDSEKENLRKEIDAVFLEKYDNLRAKSQQETLVAKVGNNMCGGCRVFLSSSVLSLLDNPQDLLKCENCGRFLFKN